MPTTIEKPKLWYRADGKPLEQRTFPEAASQSFKRGDHVYLSGGKVTAVVSAGSYLTSSGAKPLGIAERDASGQTDTPIPISIIDTQTRMVGPVTTTTAVTTPGSTYQLQRYASPGGGMNVATDQALNPVAVVTAVHPQYAVGEQYGWVEYRYLVADMASGT
ncbi:MAG TPA: hypothetical protein VG820_01440 [Fimbriimonadaceae bacterium]|nr:hypothetical protein [Fimbriimonadaceae bacterium]